jgi:two-component system, NarL family, response regulator DevR
MTNTEQSVVKVFLLAESRLLRDVLVRLLARKAGLQVVGVASSSEDAIVAAVSANPDVILCDSLSDAISDNGTIRELRRNLPKLKVLMFGMDCEEEKFLIAVQHGVTGYVLKDASASDVASAIRVVASGDSVCPPKLCSVLFNYVAGSRAWKPGVQVTKKLGLTRREQQLVELISQGLTNKEIAGRLYLSEQTVKNHLRRMFRKSGSSDRLQAVGFWRAQGFWT